MCWEKGGKEGKREGGYVAVESGRETVSNATSSYLLAAAAAAAAAVAAAAAAAAVTVPGGTGIGGDLAGRKGGSNEGECPPSPEPPSTLCLSPKEEWGETGAGGAGGVADRVEEDEKRGGGKACGKERKGRESPSRAAAVEAWEDGEVRKGEGGEEGTGTVWLLRCKRGEPPDKLEPSSPSSPVPSFPPPLLH